MHHHSKVWPTLVVGFIAGATVGIAGSSMTSERVHRKIRRQAEHAMRSMGEFAKDLGR